MCNTCLTSWLAYTHHQHMHAQMYAMRVLWYIWCDDSAKHKGCPIVNNLKIKEGVYFRFDNDNKINHKQGSVLIYRDGLIIIKEKPDTWKGHLYIETGPRLSWPSYDRLGSHSHCGSYDRIWEPLYMFSRVMIRFYKSYMFPNIVMEKCFPWNMVVFKYLCSWMWSRVRHSVRWSNSRYV